MRQFPHKGKLTSMECGLLSSCTIQGLQVAHKEGRVLLVWQFLEQCQIPIPAAHHSLAQWAGGRGYPGCHSKACALRDHLGYLDGCAGPCCVTPTGDGFDFWETWQATVGN